MGMTNIEMMEFTQLIANIGGVQQRMTRSSEGVSNTGGQWGYSHCINHHQTSPVMINHHHLTIANPFFLLFLVNMNNTHWYHHQPRFAIIHQPLFHHAPSRDTNPCAHAFSHPILVGCWMLIPRIYGRCCWWVILYCLVVECQPFDFI